MKKVIAIIGTNAVGKTTLARYIIENAGGVCDIHDGVTYCADGNTALIGNYVDGKKSAGVDEFSETTFLAEKIKSIDREYVVFEGLKCGTFGMAIQEALFAGTDSLLVFLYASAETINNRLLKRSGVGINTLDVLRAQRANLNAAIKYKSIGVKVLSVKTDDKTPQEVYEQMKGELY